MGGFLRHCLCALVHLLWARMKNLKAVPEWRRVIRKAWSIRLSILAGLFAGVDALLPVFSDAVPRWVFAALCIVASIGSIVSRLIAQESVSGPK